MNEAATFFAKAEALIGQHPTLAVVGAILLLFAKPMIERWLRGGTAWRAMTREGADVSRHLSRNSDRLGEMRALLKRGELPVRIHIQKLAITDRSMLFSDKALEDLQAERIVTVHRARVRIRNYNIDVAETLRTLDADDVAQFGKMLSYLSETNLRLSDWSPRMLTLQDMGGAPLPIVGRPVPQRVVDG